MVQSIINPDVHYLEVNDVDPEDVGHSASVCELEFPNEENRFFVVAFGKIKYTFHDRGILYYPIYLLTAVGKVHAKIGVVEVPVKHALHILDECKNIRLDMLEDPLLFAFANQDYLNRFSTDHVDLPADKKTNVEKEDTTVVEDDDDASSSVQQARQLIAHGIFQKKDRIVIPSDVPEETETEAQTMIDAFVEKDANSWIQQFLKNSRYGIHTVHGHDTDSLLTCICDAFQQLGQNTTVMKLRAVLALEATASIFRGRREAYEHVAATMDQKKKIPEHLSLEEKLRFKKQTADELAHDERLVAEMVGIQFREVTTLQHFREFIMTSRFAPDDWAIGVLERKLEMKLMILDESHFEDGDIHHVLRCHRHHHTGKPHHYIIVAVKGGGAYTLITYKNRADDDVGKRIFKFTELPWGLKQHVAQRCAEQSGHGFAADFDDLASQRGYNDKDSHVSRDSSDQPVLQFHRHASLRASPGHGPNEHVTMDQLLAFQPLRRIKAWRRKLDDTWAQHKFEVGGKTWSSVVHYTQSSKFRKDHPEYADTFALESRSALSKNVDLAWAATTGKRVKDEVKVKPSHVEVDKNYSIEDAEKHRMTAIHAKFHQNIDLQQLLKATSHAILLHYRPRHVAQPDEALMALRETLG